MKSIRSMLLWVFVPFVLSARVEAALPGDVRIEARITPSEVVPGGEAELSVTLRAEANWVCFDLEQVPGSVMPTRVDLDRSNDWAPLGTFRSEGARDEYFSTFGQRPVRSFEGSPTFRRSVRLSPDAKEGEWRVTGRCSFMIYSRTQNRFFLVNDTPFVAVGQVGRPPSVVTPASATSVETPAAPPTPTLKFVAEELPRRNPPPSFSISIDLPPVEMPDSSMRSWALIGLIVLTVGAGGMMYRLRAS